MTRLFRCPWCVVVERGMKASALMRKHILEAHRGLLIRGLGLLEAFGTHKTLDPPRNALNGHPPLNRGVSGEGDAT